MAARSFAPNVSVASACAAHWVCRAPPSTGVRTPLPGTSSPASGPPGRWMNPSARRSARPSPPHASSTDLLRRSLPPSSTNGNPSAQNARCTGSSPRITPCGNGATSSRIPTAPNPGSWPQPRTRRGRGTSPGSSDPGIGRTSTSTSSSTSSAATSSDGWSLASQLIQASCLKQDVGPETLTLHSDRGSPMTSKCSAQLLADLGITQG